MSKKLSLDIKQTGCVCVLLLVIVALMVYAIFFKKETFAMNPYPIPPGGMERDPEKMEAQRQASVQIAKLYKQYKKERIKYWKTFQNVAYGQEEDKIRLAKIYARKFNNINLKIMKLVTVNKIDPLNMSIYEKYGGKIHMGLRDALQNSRGLGNLDCYERIEEVVKRRDDFPEGYQELGAGLYYLRNAMNNLCYKYAKANINYPTYLPY